MDLAGAGPAGPPASPEVLDLDWARGARVLPLLRELVGGLVLA